MRKEEISNIISFLLIISFCFILFLSVFKQDNSRAHLPNPTTSTTTSMNTYTVKLLIFNKVNNVINESNIIYATWFCLGIWRCLVCGFVWMKERRCSFLRISAECAKSVPENFYRYSLLKFHFNLFLLL